MVVVLIGPKDLNCQASQVHLNFQDLSSVVFFKVTHVAIQGLGASHRSTDSQISDTLVVVEPGGKRPQHLFLFFQHSSSWLCNAVAIIVFL